MERATTYSPSCTASKMMLARGPGPLQAFGTPPAVLASHRQRWPRVRAASSSEEGERGGPLVRFLSSSVAAVVAEVVSLPMDVAKTRLQVSSKYSGLRHCLVSTAAEEGPLALWKGLVPALTRQVCYSSLVMVLYEPVRNGYSTLFHGGAVDADGKKVEDGFAVRLLAGGTAGALSITVFNPVEVVKTRLQSNVGAVGGASGSMIGVAKSVWHTNGVRGFWAGWSSNVARTFLVNAAEIGSYDHAKHMLIPILGDGFWSFLGASFLAGTASAIASTPADVVKTRLMNQAGDSAVQERYKGMLDCAVRTFRTEGPAGLYHGFTPILVRKVLWCAAFFLVYEELRKAGYSVLGDM